MPDRAQSGRDRSQQEHEIPQPRATWRQGQAGDERQQHEQQRQVRGIVEVRRKPFVDEALHGRRAQGLKRVPVDSEAVGIHRHQPQAERERHPQPLEAGQRFLPWLPAKRRF